jgi:hypothetical protein
MRVVGAIPAIGVLNSSPEDHDTPGHAGRTQRWRYLTVYPVPA